jgi:hypothetical protein
MGSKTIVIYASVLIKGFLEESGSEKVDMLFE